MKVIPTTEPNADSLLATVDKALGNPRRGVHIGGGMHCDMPDTWDGTGATPPGWTRSQFEEYKLSASDTWLPLDDATLIAVQSSILATAAEKAAVTAAAASRVDVSDLSDGGKRTPKSAQGQAKSQGQLEQ